MAEQPRTSRIYLVGGTANVRREMERKLARSNILISGHWEIADPGGTGMGRKSPVLRAMTDGVVYLTDASRHAHRDRAREIAEDLDVPLVVGTRNWAELFPLLVRAGLVPGQQPIIADAAIKAHIPVAPIQTTLGRCEECGITGGHKPDCSRSERMRAVAAPKTYAAAEETHAGVNGGIHRGKRWACSLCEESKDDPCDCGTDTFPHPRRYHRQGGHGPCDILNCKCIRFSLRPKPTPEEQVAQAAAAVEAAREQLAAIKEAAEKQQEAKAEAASTTPPESQEVTTPAEPSGAQAADEDEEEAMARPKLSPEITRATLTDGKAQLCADVMRMFWSRGRQFTNNDIADLCSRATGTMLNTLAIGYIRAALQIPYDRSSHSLITRWKSGVGVETYQQTEEREKRAKSNSGPFRPMEFAAATWVGIAGALNDSTFKMEPDVAEAMKEYRAKKNLDNTKNAQPRRREPAATLRSVPERGGFEERPIPSGAAARAAQALDRGRATANLPASFRAALELLKEAGASDQVYAEIKVHPDGKVEVAKYRVMTEGGGFII